MARVGIELGTSRLIAGYWFHCAIMAHAAKLIVLVFLSLHKILKLKPALQQSIFLIATYHTV